MVRKLLEGKYNTTQLWLSAYKAELFWVWFNLLYFTTITKHGILLKLFLLAPMLAFRVSETHVSDLATTWPFHMLQHLASSHCEDIYRYLFRKWTSISQTLVGLKFFTGIYSFQFSYPGTRFVNCYCHYTVLTF